MLWVALLLFTELHLYIFIIRCFRVMDGIAVVYSASSLYIYNQMFSCYGRHCCCLLSFIFINCISPFCFPPRHSGGLAAGLRSGTIHQGNGMLILLKYHSQV